jgi:ParB family transcriptional regulator, chromosome partitioning protein
MNKGLGKGLASLLGEEVNHLDANIVQEVNIEMIVANQDQPRKSFDTNSLNELSMSIKHNGILQPIIVQLENSGKYKIVAGERRWRAAKLAGLMKVPIITRDFSQQDVAEISIIENVQRVDLNVMEEAEGYKLLVDKFAYTQNHISKIIGKSRSHIANLLRLNSLSDKIKSDLRNDRISMGHARCLIGAENADDIADLIVENSLNVRQAENLVKKKLEPNRMLRSAGEKNDNNSEFSHISDALSMNLGIKVTIEGRSNGGKVVLHYSSLNQLDDILTKLK